MRLYKKKIKLLILLFLVAASSNGQELNLPVFTQYLADNSFVISPTYAGIGDNLRIRANGLAQWVGLKDSPNNQSLYADFRVFDRSGIGISLYNDKNGYTRQTGAKISFAHHLILDYYAKEYLSFGLSYNLNHFRIDSDKFNLTMEQPVLDAIVTDRYLPNNNFDLGVLYRISKFYLSLSVNNVLKKIAINTEPLNLNYWQIISFIPAMFSKTGTTAELSTSLPCIFSILQETDVLLPISISSLGNITLMMNIIG